MLKFSRAIQPLNHDNSFRLLANPSATNFIFSPHCVIAGHLRPRLTICFIFDIFSFPRIPPYTPRGSFPRFDLGNSSSMTVHGET